MELSGTSGDGDTDMDDAVYREMEQLQRMPIEQLRQRYRELYGEQSHTRHKQHLINRIGWRLQVLAQGDLSERARQRALALANDADLKVQVPSAWIATRPAPKSLKAMCLLRCHCTDRLRKIAKSTFALSPTNRKVGSRLQDRADVLFFESHSGGALRWLRKWRCP